MELYECGRKLISIGTRIHVHSYSTWLYMWTNLQTWLFTATRCLWASMAFQQQTKSTYIRCTAWGEHKAVEVTLEFKNTNSGRKRKYTEDCVILSCHLQHARKTVPQQMYGAKAHEYINEQLKESSLVYYQSPCKNQNLMFYPLKWYN